MRLLLHLHLHLLHHTSLMANSWQAWWASRCQRVVRKLFFFENRGVCLISFCSVFLTQTKNYHDNQKQKMRDGVWLVWLLKTILIFLLGSVQISCETIWVPWRPPLPPLRDARLLPDPPSPPGAINTRNFTTPFSMRNAVNFEVTTTQSE